MQDYMEKWGSLEEGESRNLLRHLVAGIQNAVKQTEEKMYTAEELLELLDSGLAYERSYFKQFG